MGTQNVLPVHHRSPSKISPISFNRLWRSKERLLLSVVCFGLVIGCFGTVFFLPDFRAGFALPSINSVFKVYKQVQNVGPELILPPPPLSHDEREAGHLPHGHHGQIDKPDIHLIQDKEKLQRKIDESESAKIQQQVIPKPFIPPDKLEITSSTK